jgi:hypothetical protein
MAIPDGHTWTQTLYLETRGELVALTAHSGSTHVWRRPALHAEKFEHLLQMPPGIWLRHALTDGSSIFGLLKEEFPRVGNYVRDIVRLDVSSGSLCSILPRDFRIEEFRSVLGISHCGRKLFCHCSRRFDSQSTPPQESIIAIDLSTLETEPVAVVGGAFM